MDAMEQELIIETPLPCDTHPGMSAVVLDMDFGGIPKFKCSACLVEDAIKEVHMR